MWTSKHADVRRQELLQAALALFVEQGFHQTSINDVIARVGVTKGAFYYYFRSMDDVVESIALASAEKMVEMARKYADTDHLDAIAKISGLIREAIGQYGIHQDQRVGMIRLLQGEENAKLAHRIHQKGVAAALPLVKTIIRQGVAEGVFDLLSVDDAAELYMQLTCLFKGMIGRVLATAADPSAQMPEITRKLAYYRGVLEAALGLQSGALALSFQWGDGWAEASTPGR